MQGLICVKYSYLPIDQVRDIQGKVIIETPQHCTYASEFVCIKPRFLNFKISAKQFRLECMIF